MELRPYQVAAVQALRKTMAAGFRRLILSSPTGSGKTEIGFEIIRGAQAKGKKVAFLANRLHLVDQTCRRLTQAGFEYGLIQGQNTSAPWRSILVCSIQSVASRGLPDVDLLVIDEAHAAAGTSAYRDVMAGKPCIGLTATPYSKGLGKYYPELGGALFERVVTAARITDLIDQGYLVSADIWAPSEPDLSGVKITAGDYNEKELGEAVDKPTLVGDIVSHWLRLANNTATVVFATNIAHSKHIRDEFLSAGVAAEHLDCYVDEDERREILERIASGETTVICNVGVLAEGWDFPACKTLILARPTKSLIRYLQMAGRVLRPYPGKERAIILDHSGAVRRIGFPWDYFGQHLDDGKPKKASDTEKEQPERLPTPCPKCSFMRPPRVLLCSSCGFESKPPNEVHAVDGQLVQVSGKPKAQKTIQGMGRYSVYGQLCALAGARDKTEGWIKANYKEIFGTWPNRQETHFEEPTPELLSWIRYKQIQWAHSHKRVAT